MTNPVQVTRRRFLQVAAATAAITELDISLLAERKPQEKGRSSMQLTPYLLFDGTCKEAMEFYQSSLGGHLTVTQVKNSPAREHMQPFQQEKVLNARLESGVLQLSASDWLMLDKQPKPGNTVCLYLSGGTLEELTSLFEKLSAGADVTNPLQPTFFGTYGALNDRFGVRWMFAGNFTANKETQRN